MRETNYQWLKNRVGTTDDSCILWPFARARAYGQVAIIRPGKKTICKAHRVMCKLAHGEPPTPRHEAAHICGNALCVNPRHLKWKTRSANQLDSVTMGRVWRGGRRGKLTRDKADRIRSLRGVVSLDKLANQFGVTFSTIAKIHRGETWK